MTGSAAMPDPPSAAEFLRLPELLAPAGDWECTRAAVENGADAVYFGLDQFNARMRANNFTTADLPALMAYLHRRGVKGYVTFNTLVFQNELAAAENYLRALIAAGVDAAIVQDAGICRMIRALSPDFPIHASTQMTITSAAGMALARELGCSRVILARECSLAEIEKIQASFKCQVSSVQSGGDANLKLETENLKLPPPLPIEVFVHGALCIAYSGQCLTSESLGGRSANRGECAQACRMPYELIADGRPVPLGDRKYLLSPQDLAGIEVLPELVRAGVASLKIEGRLKSPEYVASITRLYRQALDDLRFTIYDLRAAAPARRPAETENRQYELEMSFSRGLFTGWLGGTDNQRLVHARFGKKRGVLLGSVKKVLRDGVVVNLTGPVKPGDGIVFDAGQPEAKEEGGRVYEVQRLKAEGQSEAEAALHFGFGDIDFARVRVGDRIWKTNDPELDRRLRQSFAGDAPRFQRPVEMEVQGRAGEPLTLTVRDEIGHVVQIASALPLARAEKQPLTEAKLREQFGRLGGTPFKLGALKNGLSGEVLLPVSELNRLRRAAVAELEKLRARPPRWTLAAPSEGRVPRVPVENDKIRMTNDKGMTKTECQTGASSRSLSSLGFPSSLDIRHSSFSAGTPSELIVLVRDLGQLEAALKGGVTTVYCEFEDPKKYREAVILFHTARGCSSPSAILPPPSSPSIFIAPPRIFKTGEDWILQQVRSANADGYLIRNYDHLQFFAGARCIGDYSLNVANSLTADYFKNRFGLERLTAGYDLNAAQLDALLQAAPPEWFEVTIHQHMPLFHMEHCVFCAHLSAGKDYRDCGRPCDRHTVKLRDRVGATHPVKADAGCRNTVFNAQAQTGAEFVEHLLALGVRHFRVEFLEETPETVLQTVAKYRRLLRGEITGAQLWRELKLFNQRAAGILPAEPIKKHRTSNNER